MDRTARFRLVLVALLVLLLGTGCEIDVGVGLDVAEDGSGQVEVAVTLDADAASRVADLAGQLRVDDLVAAGWTVEGPRSEPGGGVVITASKPFARLDDAEGVLEEISGLDGPFRDFNLRREPSFLTTTYRFDGVVDLRDGIEGFSDEGLRQRLEGSGFGLGTAEIEELTGAPVGETFNFEVRARLPGTSDADAEVWTPVVGERTALTASSQLVHGLRLASLLVGAVAALGLVAVLAARRRRS